MLALSANGTQERQAMTEVFVVLCLQAVIVGADRILRLK